MAGIVFKWSVVDNPNADNGVSFDCYIQAEKYAVKYGKCIIELTFEYSDSELVADYRTQGSF